MGALSLIKTVPSAVVRATGKTLFALRRMKPQILVGGGLVIATGAFVLAIVNARKIDSAISEGNAKVDAIEKDKEAYVSKVQGHIDDKEVKTVIKKYNYDINKAKVESIAKMFELVGIPTLMFAGGIAMTLGGHIILFRRFGQVSVSLAALKKSFDRYRAMNIAEHGEDCDKRYLYGITGTKTITEKITDENGKEKEVKTKLPVVDHEKESGLYVFEFSERTSRRCPRDPLDTISYLNSQQKIWNMWLGTGKPVTLVMVLDELGIEYDPDDPEQDYILIAGWRPNGDGDNKIDFGIMRAVNKRTIEMEDNVIMLNFNCDGSIYHSKRYPKYGGKVSGKK